MSGLVLLALAADEVALRVVALGPSELAARDGELERRQVLALEEVVQMRGREVSRLRVHVH